MEVQLCDGEGAVAFHVSTGSFQLTVFIALSPVKSPQTRTDSVLEPNSLFQKKSTFKQDFGYSKFSTEAA